MKKTQKSPEQVAQEKLEIVALKQKIAVLIGRVPKKVMSGSYQMAVNWKIVASQCQKLLEAKIDSVEKLRAAYAKLYVFEA